MKTDEEIRRRCPDCGKCHDCQWEKDVSILWKLLLIIKDNYAEVSTLFFLSVKI